MVRGEINLAEQLWVNSKATVTTFHPYEALGRFATFPWPHIPLLLKREKVFLAISQSPSRCPFPQVYLPSVSNCVPYPRGKQDSRYKCGQGPTESLCPTLYYSLRTFPRQWRPDPSSVTCCHTLHALMAFTHSSDPVQPLTGDIALSPRCWVGTRQASLSFKTNKLHSSFSFTSCPMEPHLGLCLHMICSSMSINEFCYLRHVIGLPVTSSPMFIR